MMVRSLLDPHLLGLAGLTERLCWATENPEASVGAKVDEAALHNFFFAKCGEIKHVRLQVRRSR